MELISAPVELNMGFQQTKMQIHSARLLYIW